jgi:hypothetical protein
MTTMSNAATMRITHSFILEAPSDGITDCGSPAAATSFENQERDRGRRLVQPLVGRPFQA